MLSDSRSEERTGTPTLDRKGGNGLTGGIPAWRDRRTGPPNTKLTNARLRTPSPSGSGQPMSRQELAEAVNTYLWITYQRRTALDATYVGKLENGTHHWPQDLYREADYVVTEIQQVRRLILE